MRKIILIAGLLFIGWLSVYANSIKLYYAPEKNWMQYKTPEEAGWSVQKLREAHKYFQKVGLSTAMLIYKGKVVVNWGNTNRIFLCHSVRKSFLSTLYGIYATNGDININDTLADINFNDKPPLTKAQQQATIRDLLTCTSGIARDKANPEASFKKVINGKEVIVHYYDKLNSYKPGTHFQYSNWSFNALGGIFNKETKSDLFNDFYNDIAKPIGMQNFSLHQNTFYQYNKYSLFPKYGFLMTTQDMARYGLLYLNNGNWNGKQIISENWVKKSTSTQVKTKDKMDLPFNGYGYLWWTCDSGYFKNHPVYSALGFAGQTINVFPKEDIVIVTHNNTYRLHADNFHYVNNKKTGILLELLLKAKTGSSEKNPALIPLKTTKQMKVFDLPLSCARSYVGLYKLSGNSPVISLLKKCTIYLKNDKLYIKSPAIFDNELLPQSKNKFIIKGLDLPLKFKLNNSEKHIRLSFYFMGNVCGKKIL